jgi:hypothetical protein
MVGGMGSRPSLPSVLSKGYIMPAKKRATRAKAKPKSKPRKKAAPKRGKRRKKK